jgi:glycosyltransferase involved in cell wall biosynthesis
MRIPALLTVPDSRLTWAELVTCADVFVLPALSDVSTGPMAVAMAAGLPVVASAVRSVAELIAHGKNGLLCKPGDAKALAGRILTAIEDAELVRKLTDVARAQVFETCSLRGYVDNYGRLYQNVLTGRAPGEDICDTAMVA